MPFSEDLNVLIPVFLTIAVGYLFGKIRKIEIKPVVDLVLYITVPCLILSSLLKAPLPINDFILIPAFAVLVVLGVGIMTFLITKSLRIEFTPGIYIGSMFMNSGIIAFPIALSAYGAKALSKAIVFDATNGILIFSLGVFLLVGRQNFREIFKLPVIYAIAAATVINCLKLPVHGALLKTMTSIGGATIPVMLLILGYQLNHIRPNVVRLSVLSALLRLAGGLAIAVAAARIFGISGVTKNVLILSSSMPSAINSLLLTEKYGVDPDLAAGAVMISTVLAFILIPLILIYVI